MEPLLDWEIKGDDELIQREVDKLSSADYEERKEYLEEHWTDIYVNKYLKPVTRNLISQREIIEVPGCYNDYINNELTKNDYMDMLEHLEWPYPLEPDETLLEGTEAGTGVVTDPDTTPDPEPDTTTEPDTGDSGSVQVSIDTSDMGDLEKGIATAFEDAISIDRESIQQDVAKEVNDLKKKVEKKLDELEARTPRKIEVERPDGSEFETEKQHKKFDEVLKLASLRHNVLLSGPTGSGKTRLAREVSKALDLDYYEEAISPTSRKYHFFGRWDPDGKEVIRTSFRDAYEHGGVYCLDEIDTAEATCLKAINSAIGNGHATFPDGEVEKHEDFIIIATANTWGKGSSHEYAGNALGASSLDRFKKVFFDYDPDLEKQLVGETDWLKWCHEAREVNREKNLRVPVSTRTILDGQELIEEGFDMDRVKELTLLESLNESKREKLEGNVEVV